MLRAAVVVDILNLIRYGQQRYGRCLLVYGSSLFRHYLGVTWLLSIIG